MANEVDVVAVVSNIQKTAKGKTESINISHKKARTILAAALLQREYLLTKSAFQIESMAVLR